MGKRKPNGNNDNLMQVSNVNANVPVMIQNNPLLNNIVGVNAMQANTGMDPNVQVQKMLLANGLHNYPNLQPQQDANVSNNNKAPRHVNMRNNQRGRSRGRGRASMRGRGQRQNNNNGVRGRGKRGGQRGNH